MKIFEYPPTIKRARELERICHVFAGNAGPLRWQQIGAEWHLIGGTPEYYCGDASLPQLPEEAGAMIDRCVEAEEE